MDLVYSGILHVKERDVTASVGYRGSKKSLVFSTLLKADLQRLRYCDAQFTEFTGQREGLDINPNDLALVRDCRSLEA